MEFYIRESLLAVGELWAWPTPLLVEPSLDDFDDFMTPGPTASAIICCAHF